MKNQTAVEWLVEMLIDNKYLIKDAEHLFEQAKEMEKMQVKEAFDEGNWFSDSYHGCEHYYNKIYGKE